MTIPTTNPSAQAEIDAAAARQHEGRPRPHPTDVNPALVFVRRERSSAIVEVRARPYADVEYGETLIGFVSSIGLDDWKWLSRAVTFERVGQPVVALLSQPETAEGMALATARHNATAAALRAADELADACDKFDVLEMTQAYRRARMEQREATREWETHELSKEG